MNDTLPQPPLRDLPPPSSPLNCVRYELHTFSNDEGQAEQKHVLLFYCDAFTPAVLLGGRASSWGLSDKEFYGTLDEIPLGNFARWLCCVEQRQWPDWGARHSSEYGYKDAYDMPDPLVRWVVDRLHNNHYNDEATLDAVHFGVNSTIKAHLPDDHPSGPGAPVELWMDDTDLDRFVAWYEGSLVEFEEQKKQRRIDEQCEGLYSSLHESVSTMRRVRAEQMSRLVRLQPILQKLAVGSAVLDLCDKFGMTTADRKKVNKSWANWQYTDRQYVDPPPDDAWRDRFTTFKRRWQTELVGRCVQIAETKASRNAFDVAANAFVDDLREDGAPYLAMLKNYGTLLPGSKRILSNTLEDGFRLAMMSQTARERLVQGEVMGLARLFATYPTPDPPSGGSGLGKEVLDAMGDFSPDVAAPDEETPFAKWAADSFTTAQDLKGQGESMLSIVVAATPAIVKELDTRTGGKITSMTWLWKAVAGGCQLTPKQSDKLVKAFADGTWDSSKYEAVENEVMKDLLARAGHVVRFANVLSRTIQLRFALLEVERANSYEKQAAVLESLASFISFTEVAFELPGGDITDFTFDLSRSIKGVEFGTAVSIVGDALAIAISYSTYRAVKKKKQTRKTIEDARMQIGFDVAKFLLSTLSLLVGAEFVVAGFVIMAIKELVMNPDAWVPTLVPWMARKSAPHRFLENLLSEIIQDEELQKLLAKFKSPEKSAFETQLSHYWERLAIAPAEGQTIIWDVGGTKKSNLTYTARDRAFAVWKIPRKTLTEIIVACDHG